MSKRKTYGIYVLDLKLETYILWFDTEEERDKVFDKIKPDKITRKVKKKETVVWPLNINQ